MMPRLALVLALSLAACDTEPYCLDCVPDASRAIDASFSGGSDGPRPDGPDGASCIPGPEVCNGLDDDCNDLVDDQAAFVGESCNENLPSPCTAGTYECVAGTLTCDGGAVLPKAETCNDVDDDCDGMVDDGDPGGGSLCGTDVGDCLRGVTGCVNGVVDCLGEINPAPELCDGRDNDCDGAVDQGNPGGGELCGASAGTCVPGTVTCVGGVLQCLGASGPTIETCNSIDDDCDGATDEDFDFMTHPQHCGGCGISCSANQAVATCSSGHCVIAYCLTNYWDLDGEYATGCEHACVYKGFEICNGEDDDCDGVVDEGLTPPPICASLGECAGTIATCAGPGGWVCSYGATVSTDMSGVIVPETNCDGRDNDCDGVSDDAFPGKGQPCTAGLGVCQTAGVMVCNEARDGLTCSAPPPLAPLLGELCNGLDDNCNGVVDEDAVDTNYVAMGATYMMMYEASRPDASATSAGASSGRACSNPGVLPWTNITQPQAELACAAAGARLCTEAEWGQACEATATCTWSYDATCTTYEAAKCNGNDHDFDPVTAGDQDGLLPTASLAGCRAAWGGGVFDLSGNAKEWTQERAAGINPLRGGSYNNTAAGISCPWSFVVADDSFQFANVGFRCCRDTAP